MAGGTYGCTCAQVPRTFHMYDKTLNVRKLSSFAVLVSSQAFLLED